MAAPLACVARSQHPGAPDRLLTWSCEIRGLVRDVTNRFRGFMSLARAQGRLASSQRYHGQKRITGRQGRSVTFGENVLCGFAWTFDPPRFFPPFFPQHCVNLISKKIYMTLLVLLFPVTQIRLQRSNISTAVLLRAVFTLQPNA